MSRHTIGFDRDIDIRWMDAVAGRVAAGESGEELRRYVWKLLEGEVAGDAPRSGRGKTATVLMHVWARVPEDLVPLRDRALEVVTSGSPGDRIAAHWTMTMATYPFFADVVSVTGRLLGLQQKASLAQITRRLVERWGDRSSMIRAVRRVVRSVVRWGLMLDSERHGTYAALASRLSIRGPVAGILLEAAIRSGESADVPFDALVRHPALFPFALLTTPRELVSTGFAVHRSGNDTDSVSLIRRQLGTASTRSL